MLLGANHSSGQDMFQTMSRAEISCTEISFSRKYD